MIATSSSIATILLPGCLYPAVPEVELSWEKQSRFRIRRREQERHLGRIGREMLDQAGNHAALFLCRQCTQRPIHNQQIWLPQQRARKRHLLTNAQREMAPAIAHIVVQAQSENSLQDPG
jgi:DTW domain-containing protein YfiP